MRPINLFTTPKYVRLNCREVQCDYTGSQNTDFGFRSRDPAIMRRMTGETAIKLPWENGSRREGEPLGSNRREYFYARFDVARAQSFHSV